MRYTISLQDSIIINGLRERKWKHSIEYNSGEEHDEMRNKIQILVNEDIVKDFQYLVIRNVITKQEAVDQLKSHGITDEELSKYGFGTG